MKTGIAIFVIFVLNSSVSHAVNVTRALPVYGDIDGATFTGNLQAEHALYGGDDDSVIQATGSAYCSDAYEGEYISHLVGSSLDRRAYYSNGTWLYSNGTYVSMTSITCDVPNVIEAGGVVSPEVQQAILETNETIELMTRLIAAIGSLSLLFMGFNSGMHR